MDNNTIIIIGSIVSLLLAINGYFIKQLVNSLFEVRIRVEVLISKHDSTEKIAEKNAADIVNLREKLHKIEGGYLQVIQFIEDYNKEK